MKGIAISFKECWQDVDGKWYSYGGFPLQMTAIASLFDEMTLLITRGKARSGGLPLPPQAKIVPLRKPIGEDGRRKLDIIQHLPYYVREIQKHLREADVVHTPLPGDIPLIAMFLAILNRKYLIARYGGSWITNTQTTFMNRVTRGMMRFCAGGKSLMLATGYEELEPAPKMHWIFSSPLTETFLSTINPTLNRSLSNPPQLAYIGRLSPEKGVKVLVQAMSQLKTKLQNTPMPELTIIGGGAERAELEALVQELACDDVIQFVGQVNREQLTKLLMPMDICVQPSLTEGFSKAWLDAMAHGLPVVASNVGAAQAVIGYNGERGWITEAGNVALLSNLLCNLLEQPHDWSAIRKRCRLYAESLTLEQWAEHIGTLSATQWQIEFSNGKLYAK